MVFQPAFLDQQRQKQKEQKEQKEQKQIPAVQGLETQELEAEKNVEKKVEKFAIAQDVMTTPTGITPDGSKIDDNTRESKSLS